MENINTERKAPPTEFMLTPERERAQVNFWRKNMTVDLSSDFTLPDYLPEIRKMLGIHAKISPISRYISGNGIEFSGRVDYDMVYMGGDGSLATAPLGEDFSFEATPEVPHHIDWNSSNDATADVETDMLHCRVTAPRKVNVKCRLHALVRAYGYDEPCSALGSSAYGAEKLCAEAECTEVHRYVSEVIELGDELPVSAITESIRPIIGRGSVNINETSQSGRRLNCRGEVITDIIYENTETGEINSSKRRIPFTQDIDVSEGDETDVTGASYCVSGICGDVKMSVGDGKLLIDTEAILEAQKTKNIPVNVTRDIFIPGKESSVSYRDFKYETAERSANGKLTVKGETPLSELSASYGCEVINCLATMRVEGISAEDGRNFIVGSCRMWVLTKNGEEFSSGEIITPFKLDTGIAETEKDLSLMIRPAASECSCRAEDDKMLYEASISLPYCIMKQKSMRISDGIATEEKETGGDPRITVYYPTENETLWNVAKRFGVSLRSLAEANDLPSIKGDETLSQKHFIMIY